MRVSLPETWIEAREHLVPVLRGVTRPAGSLRAASLGRGLLRYPFAPFLSGLLALDLPRHRVFIKPDHLEPWRVDRQVAWLTAVGNLPPHVGLHHRQDGLWELQSRDGYESSRLLLPGWLAAFSHQVRGRPVAIAPHARCLLVGGAAEATQVDALLRLAFDLYRSSGDPVSPALYTVDGAGGVVPYQADPDHPWAGRIRRNHLLLAGQEYSQQAEELQHVGLEVAHYTLVSSRQQSFSFCRWREGTLPLLPLTDVVVLETESGEGLTLPWRALSDGVDVRPELDPPRFAPRAWPSLASLRSQAMDLPIPG